MVRWTNALKPAATSVPAGSMTWVMNPPQGGSPLQVVVDEPGLGRIWRNVALY
jgi:hypothetical protein